VTDLVALGVVAGAFVALAVFVWLCDAVRP
jgi:hypothetical protein